MPGASIGVALQRQGWRRGGDAEPETALKDRPAMQVRYATASASLERRWTRHWPCAGGLQLFGCAKTRALPCPPTRVEETPVDRSCKGRPIENDAHTLTTPSQCRAPSPSSASRRSSSSPLTMAPASSQSTTPTRTRLPATKTTTLARLHTRP